LSIQGSRVELQPTLPFFCRQRGDCWPHSCQTLFCSLNAHLLDCLTERDLVY
jgi:hypothetical protein